MKIKFTGWARQVFAHTPFNSPLLSRHFVGKNEVFPLRKGKIKISKVKEGVHIYFNAECLTLNGNYLGMVELNKREALMIAAAFDSDAHSTASEVEH